MKKLILIKLGGSIVTDKSGQYKSRPATIARLAKEIKSARQKTKDLIVVGHGAGSFAHIPAVQYKTKEGFINNRSAFGACVTKEAADWLNRIVVKEFISQKLPVFPFAQGSFVLSDAKVYSKSYLDPLENALKFGLIPVVYGDVIMDKKLGCTIFSTEKILSIIAKAFKNKYKIRIIYATDVDGVYDERKQTIPVITQKNFESVKKSIIGSGNTDTTGGMLHKVEESLKLAKETGIETVIINGNKKGYLRKAILGSGCVATQIRSI